MRSVVKDLKGRLKDQKKTHVVTIISDAINIVTNALTIAAIVFPPLIILSAAFAVVSMLAKHIYNQINNYTFENKIGMIERSEEDMKGCDSTLWKVKDFARWYFDPLIKLFEAPSAPIPETV